MSMQAVEFVLANQAGQKLPAAARLVWLYLGWRCNDEGIASPGLRRIARECGLSRPGVLGGLGSLEERGLLRRMKQCRGRGFGRTVYQLTLDTPLVNGVDHPDEAAGGQKQTGKVVNFRGQGGQVPVSSRGDISPDQSTPYGENGHAAACTKTSKDIKDAAGAACALEGAAAPPQETAATSVAEPGLREAVSWRCESCGRNLPKPITRWELYIEHPPDGKCRCGGRFVHLTGAAPKQASKTQNRRPAMTEKQAVGSISEGAYATAPTIFKEQQT